MAVAISDLTIEIAALRSASTLRSSRAAATEDASLAMISACYFSFCFFLFCSFIVHAGPFLRYVLFLFQHFVR
jgi:hypothetical protein